MTRVLTKRALSGHLDKISFKKINDIGAREASHVGLPYEQQQKMQMFAAASSEVVVEHQKRGNDVSHLFCDDGSYHHVQVIFYAFC